MATVNVDKMSLKDLLDLQVKVERAISVAKDREKAEVKQKIASLAENAGFSVNELFGGRGRGKVVAAKYMNPDNRSETWTGRGRKPNWLVAKLKKGATSPFKFDRTVAKFEERPICRALFLWPSSVAFFGRLARFSAPNWDPGHPCPAFSTRLLTVLVGEII